jgi:hypothetical protein
MKAGDVKVPQQDVTGGDGRLLTVRLWERLWEQACSVGLTGLTMFVTWRWEIVLMIILKPSKTFSVSTGRLMQLT